ncbi:radical SAM protein [Candidatus Sumerlaeota bacterium]|nr:radical SAM protein [Candidatus Sumerlaeota bacterium]
MSSPYKYLFGPVASRRLGLSLGVDIIPFKTCTYNCVYCECGPTTRLTVERRSWVKPEEVLAEIEHFLARQIPTDFITFSGSGEPTLNKDIGWLISEIKKRTNIPVSVLTNGSLLWDESVRQALYSADLVIPSLDAVSDAVFKRINRPHPALNINTIIDGIVTFRREFQGNLWLEILLCKGINDASDEIERLADAIQRINPDKVQVGTVVRPPAVPGIKPVDKEFLEDVVNQFGDKAEIIGLPAGSKKTSEKIVSDNDIINLLRRRPTTAEELGRAFDVSPELLAKQLYQLQQRGKILVFQFEGNTFYKVK